MLKGTVNLTLKEGVFHSADGYNVVLIIHDHDKNGSNPLEEVWHFESQKKEYNGKSKQE